MSTSAIGAVGGAVVSLVCSAVYFPLALAVAVVVLVVAVLALRSGVPDRRWYVTAVVLALVSSALCVLGFVVVGGQ